MSKYLLRCLAFSQNLSAVRFSIALFSLDILADTDSTGLKYFGANIDVDQDFPAELPVTIEAAQFPSPTVDPIYTKTPVRTTGD